MPKGQNRSSAVMAQKVRGEVQTDTAEQALWRKLEFFPTPPWAARAGAELVQRLDPGPWAAHEPACGQGHMAAPLGEHFPTVVATDIHDHGWAGQHQVVDYLSEAGDAYAVDWVMTNPPFETAAEFVRLGLKRARRGVALLQRLQFMETVDRYALFFGAEPLTVLAPFTERVAMTLGRWEPKAASATAYAWFVWMHPVALVAAGLRCSAINAATPIVLPIPPGTKARLTRPDDARLFGHAEPMPLFEGVSE